MQREQPPSSAASGRAAELLPLAMSRPAVALTDARALLRSGRDPLVMSFCYHAMGIVQRDRGELGAALRILRRGLRVAQSTGLSHRCADINATLGTVLALDGRPDEARAAFDLALSQARGLDAAKVRMRRASSLYLWAGQAEHAIADLHDALKVFRRHDQPDWEAFTLTNRATAFSARGYARLADADLGRAEEIWSQLDRPYTAAMARHNRGVNASLQGDLPTALSHLDSAAAQYEAIDVTHPELAVDRAHVLMQAGMFTDALSFLGQWLASARRSTGVRRGPGLLLAAELARRTGEASTSAAYARRARALFQRADNPEQTARCNLLLLALAADDQQSNAQRLLRRADALAQDPALPSVDRVELQLLSARIARERADPRRAGSYLAAAARHRRHGTPLTRARAWLAFASLADLEGRGPEVLRRCDAGLTLLDEHRLTVGASEIRAAITSYGSELAELGLRQALATDDPAVLLTWSERWRAMTLAAAAVRPPDDHALATDLTALRDVTRRQSLAAQNGDSDVALERERRRLEESARARSLRTRGEGSASVARHDPAALVGALGRAALVELVDVDGALHVVVVGRSGIHRHAAGDFAAAAAELDHVRFALHRLARPSAGRAGTALAAAAAASLDASGAALEKLLLGDAADDLGHGPVVVVPSGKLHAVPWGLLPSLRRRNVTVAPSAAVWLRGRRSRPPRGGKVALVQGPDLGSGGAELPELARMWQGATHLHGPAATADAVLAALDGARLAHIAAHGEFRSDNPMFSSLQVADGPLTVHDFCRMTRAPYRMVLSACESGLGMPTGSDELLGLVSALVPLGTVGLLASIVPVNDEATVPLMLTVHRRLTSGGTLAQGLCDARSAAGDDPLARATAASFVALGSA